MRILVHDRSGHAFTVQLTRELARRGHLTLHSYASFFQSPKGNLSNRSSDPPFFNVQGIHLNEPFAKYSYFRRWFQERKYAKELVKQIALFQPETVILASVPPDVCKLVIDQLKHRDIRFIFWVQDLYSVAIEKILSKSSSILSYVVSKYYSRIEKSVLQQSHGVVLITDDFLPLLSKWKIEPNVVSVIPNWAPYDELRIKPRNNAWAIEHGLIGTPCLLYSGTIGLKHNPDLLLKLAIFFRNRSVKVVVVSEGLGAEWLRAKRDEYGLSNLLILDFQPFERLSEVLDAADVLIAILETDAGVFSVPSKILTYLCAGKPLLLAVPLENQAARTVMKNKTGIVVKPDDFDAFLKAAIQLLEDPNLRMEYGQNALEYAQKNFDIKRIADQFEQVIFASELASRQR